MKKIFLALCALAALAACTQSLNQEIFTKKVYLVQNGFQELELNFTENSIVDTTISVAVSGTVLTSEDVAVTMKVNADTLAGYNWDRFRNDRSMYYELLPEDCYTFKKEGIVIKAGEPLATIPITFNLILIDKDKKYVLPLEIATTSVYELAEPRYRTVLINVICANEYSGAYSLSGRIIEVSANDQTDIRMTRTLRAEGKSIVSLFAGSTAENMDNREDYRMLLKVNADSTLTLRASHPDKISIKADEPNLDIESPVNRIRVVETFDTQNSHRKFVTTYYYLRYNFTDYTLPDPVEMRWEGQASRTRTVLVP